MSDDEVSDYSSNDEAEGEGKHDDTEDKRLIASQKISIASQATLIKTLEKGLSKAFNMLSNLKRKAGEEGVPAEPARLEGRPPRYESPLKRQKVMPDMEDVNEALNGDETGEADDLLFGCTCGWIRATRSSQTGSTADMELH